MIESMIRAMAQEKQEQIEDLKFFDAGIWLGMPVEYYAPTSRELGIGDIAEVLSAYRYTGALLSHTDGFMQSAQEGNGALVRAASGLPDSVFFIWTGLPLFPKEQGPLPGSGPVPERVRGVRLFPKTHKYPLEPWILGSLADWLADVRMPLFLWHVETDWQALYAFAKKYSHLCIVLEGQWQKILYHNRVVYNLLRECGNILLELSNYIVPDGIFHLAREVGANRLVYGSFLPHTEPYAPMGLVMDSGLSREEKLLIAGETMRTIIGGVRV